MPTLAVVIPVHQGGEKFRCCLAAVLAGKEPPEELIVIIDGQDDGSGDFAAGQGAQVLRTAVRGGPALARNLGARQATSDLLLFLDADVQAPPELFGRVRSLMQREPGVTAAIGCYDDAPQAKGLASQYKNLLQHYVHQSARERGFTFWGACGVVRREAFIAAGGYDERYTRPCIEDIELGSRLTRAGCEIRLAKDLSVRHLKHWTWLKLMRSDFFDRALPWSELILRTGRAERDLNLDDKSRAAVALGLLAVSALTVSPALPLCALLAAALLSAQIALDLPLLAFFRRKRGLAFALATIPLHRAYYLIGGIAFGAALVRHAARLIKRAIGRRPRTLLDRTRSDS